AMVVPSASLLVPVIVVAPATSGWLTDGAAVTIAPATVTVDDDAETVSLPFTRPSLFVSKVAVAVTWSLTASAETGDTVHVVPLTDPVPTSRPLTYAMMRVPFGPVDVPEMEVAPSESSCTAGASDTMPATVTLLEDAE